MAYAGCQAQDAQRFTGCYQTCTNGGERRTSGTFDGVRLQRINDPETSNIELLSERRVSVWSKGMLSTWAARSTVYSSSTSPIPPIRTWRGVAGEGQVEERGWAYRRKQPERTVLGPRDD